MGVLGRLLAGAIFVSEDDEHVSPGFGDPPTRGPPEQVHQEG
jgi:hypothetical protein